MQHVPSAIFVFCFGACVGSFVNVVNYRLPAGMSIATPPSRCPTCGARLRFFRENLPILGWLLVRGRCRYCGVKISAEYMVIELLMALLFLGLYLLLFTVHPGSGWWGGAGGWWWYTNGFFRAWPAYFVFAFLFASLVSMTIIDARTFTIPIQIPVFVTVVAFVLYPFQAALPLYTFKATWPIPCLSWQWTAVTFGGMLGVILAFVLLKSGRLRYSFADYHEYVSADQAIGDYPHARREMLVEIRYLLPVLIGVVAGFAVGRLLPAAPPPQPIQGLAASMAGYLTGGGLIWAVRILGSLGFGREAMGLGDVHLLGAIGAVLGWFDPILIFFIAPFSGILWAMVSMGLGSVFRQLRRELPYGPHLALATVIVFLGRPAIEWGWHAIMPLVPLPEAGFFH